MPSILETIFNPTEAAGIYDINKTLAFRSIGAAAASAGAYKPPLLKQLHRKYAGYSGNILRNA